MGGRSIFAEGFSTDPWWWRDAPSVAYPEPPPATADVVVIGAGYAGLSAATELAAAGRSTVLVDVRRVGEGASGRNAGLVSGRQGISKMIDLVAYVGEERAAAILDEADEAYLHFQGLVADHAPGAFQDRGRFVAASSARAFVRLQKKFAEYESARRADAVGDGGGPDTGQELIPKHEVGRFVGSDVFHGGMASRDAGLAHPALFVHGLRRRAEAAGVQIHTGVRVIGVEKPGGGDGSAPSTVSLADGRTITAADVVLTTNGYTDAAAPWHRARIVPMSSTIIALEPLGNDRVKALLPAMTTFIDTNRVIVYARPTPDGEGILFGGRAKFRPISEETSARILRDQMLRVFPSLDEVKITHCWSGFMAFTPDFLPKIGRHDGLWYALGCNGGSGVVLMPWLGRAVAQAVLGVGSPDEPVSSLEGLPFKRQPLGRFTSKFVAAAGAWYGLRDAIDMRAGTSAAM